MELFGVWYTAGDHIVFGGGLFSDLSFQNIEYQKKRGLLRDRKGHRALNQYLHFKTLFEGSSCRRNHHSRKTDQSVYRNQQV